MFQENCRKYLEVLELSPEATLADIRKAYLFLKQLYSTESIVTLPLSGEVPADRQQGILEEIEEAYSKLSALAEKKAPGTRDLGQVKVECSHYSGPVLREVREKLGINLQDVALATNIQAQYLEDIEAENFKALPVYVYTRGYVTNYAKYLSLDVQKVTEDYMSRYNAWKMGN